MELRESLSKIVKNNRRRVPTALAIATMGFGVAGCGVGSKEAHVPETAEYLGKTEPGMGDEEHTFIFSEQNRADINEVECNNKEVEDPNPDGSMTVTCGTNFLYDMKVVVDR